MRKAKIYIGFGMLLLAALVAVGQKQMPPEGGTPKDFVLPEVETFELGSGLKATLVPYGTLPKVTVQLVIQAGNIDEVADKVWLADLTGDLMKEGTTSRSAEDIANEAASMGGSVNIGVGVQTTVVSGDVLSEFGGDLVGLIADIVQNPLFPESEVDRLKKDMLRNLSIQKTQPESLAMEKFRAVLYGDHPYGRIFPTPEIIDSFTIDDARSFYEDNFGAAKARIYVVGRFDKASVKKTVQESFDGWVSGTEPAVRLPQPESKRSIFLVDRPGSQQSTLNIGLPVIDPSHQDWIGLQVMDALLGGSFVSRITSNIREDKGYTYSPYSQVSARYRDAYWMQFASVGNSVTGPAIKEILYEIDRLRNEAPSAEELKSIQNNMAGIFVLQNSSRSGIAGILFFRDFHGLEDDYLTSYVQKVHSFTPADIQNLAAEYIDPDKLTIVVVGDKSQIIDQLTDFGEIFE